MTYGTDPGYWLYETTGVLRPAVEAYLAGSMSPIQIAAMRAYLRQWIEAPAWEHGLSTPRVHPRWLAWMRRRVDGLDSTEMIRAWIVDAINAGMDPL